MNPNYDRWKLMSPDEECDGEDFDSAWDRIRFDMEDELADAYETLRRFANELEPWTDYNADEHVVVQAAKDAWETRRDRQQATLDAVQRMCDGLNQPQNGLEDTR